MPRVRDAYDDAFEEGVGNWNFLRLAGPMNSDPFWVATTALPETKPAVTAYARAPYLGLLTTDQLFERFRILGAATMAMDDDGFLSPAPWDMWHDKWIHAAVELTFRDLSPIDERARPDWSFARTPRVLRAMAALKRRRLEWGPHVLVKYGEPRFLRQALDEGRFRIAPASYYSDPTLNPAQRDDEQSRQLIDAATELTSTLGPLGDTITSSERGLYTHPVQVVVDYYIFCVAGGWYLRLFDDFDADACLVITDPQRFARELSEAVRRTLPGWHCAFESVRYIDPVQPVTSLSDEERRSFMPFLCKDFRYWYQHEVRAAWLPPTAKGADAKLDYLYVTLESLVDYCELIET